MTTLILTLILNGVKGQVCLNGSPKGSVSSTSSLNVDFAENVDSTCSAAKVQRTRSVPK